MTQFTTSTLSLHVIGSYWTRLGEKDKFIAIEAFARGKPVTWSWNEGNRSNGASTATSVARALDSAGETTNPTNRCSSSRDTIHIKSGGVCMRMSICRRRSVAVKNPNPSDIESELAWHILLTVRIHQ